MRAALLTIGNEVSSGQIVNSNAAWISQRLDWFKIDVKLHITVQDEDSQIFDALNFIENQVDLIFVTGGLGPTRDDLTRHSVCHWLRDQLVFHQESWDRIQRRLSDLGISVSESNRQQCYFPKNSLVLENQAGTANGFYSQHQQQHLWCLPGPPREILQIWTDHIQQQLTSLCKDSIAGSILYRWQCLGKSESALGELVESAIQGSTLTSGYRPHIPFVEIKLWDPDGDTSKNLPYIAAMEEAIQPWIVGRDDVDLALILAQQLKSYDSIKIFDFSKGGYLAYRLGSALAKVDFTGQLSMVSEWTPQASPPKIVHKCLELGDPETLTLCLDILQADGSWELGLAYNGFFETETLSSSYKSRKLSDRFIKLQVERSFYHWPQLLQRLPTGQLN